MYVLCADSAAECFYVEYVGIYHSFAFLILHVAGFLWVLFPFFLKNFLEWLFEVDPLAKCVCLVGWLVGCCGVVFVLQYSGWSQRPTLLQLCTHSSEYLYFTFILKRYFSWIQNSVLTTVFFWHFRKCLCIFILAAMVSVEKATAFASLFPIRNLSVSLVVLSFLSLSFGWFQCLLALSGCEFLLFILFGICWASAPVRIEAWGDSTEI